MTEEATVKKLRSLMVLIAGVLFATTAAAADYKAEAAKEGPPKDKLSEAIAKQVGDQGIKVSEGSDPLAEFWFAKEVEIKPGFEPTFTILYPFKQGQLLGVARYHETGGDYRGQEIEPGVYTVRYALQPVDGNHIGTSDTRDFLLLVPAKMDTKPEPIAEAELFPMSAEAAGTTHPAILALKYAGKKIEDAPRMKHHEDGDLWSVGLTLKAKAKDETSELPVELVVAGMGEQ